MQTSKEKRAPTNSEVRGSVSAAAVLVVGNSAQFSGHVFRDFAFCNWTCVCTSPNAMERPIRQNAGVAAAHFSQDESLYLGKRQRPAYFDVCLRCQVAHRSEKKRERCRRADAADKRLDKACPHCQVPHRSEKERERCQKSNAINQSRVHCQHCGGSHR
jgi:hypothetical protein